MKLPYLDPLSEPLCMTSLLLDVLWETRVSSLRSQSQFSQSVYVVCFFLFFRFRVLFFNFPSTPTPMSERLNSIVLILIDFCTPCIVQACFVSSFKVDTSTITHCRSVLLLLRAGSIPPLSSEKNCSSSPQLSPFFPISRFFQKVVSIFSRSTVFPSLF